jgi:hypothetical protein
VPWPGGDADPRATVMALPQPRRRSRADVHLVVWAGSSFLPFGAPLRLHYRLHQLSSQGLLLPENLQVKGGFVSCSVTGLTPVQPTRVVRPYVDCEDGTALTLVKPGGAVDGTATLLWSDDGMLLPQPGRYRVQVEVAWPLAGEWQSVSGSVHVVVAPLPDEQASRFGLANEDERKRLQEVLRDLVVPSEAFTQAGEWLDALHRAKPRPLWPHYAYFQWKRWAFPGPRRSVDPLQALGALDRASVLTTSELKKIHAWLANQRAQGVPLAAEIKRVKGFIPDWRNALAAWSDLQIADAVSSHTPANPPPDSSESL